MKKIGRNDVGKKFVYRIADNYDEAHDKSLKAMGVKSRADAMAIPENPKLWEGFKAFMNQFYQVQYSDVTVIDVTKAGKFVRVQDKYGKVLEFTYCPQNKILRRENNFF